MFHIPMSSPMMTRMFGLFACAKTLLAEIVAINAIETANIAVNEDLVGFIDPNFGRNALCAILDLSLMGLQFSCPGLLRNGNQDDWCRYNSIYGSCSKTGPSPLPFPLVPSLLPIRPIHPSSSPHPGTSQRFRGSRWQVSFRRGVVGTPGTPWVHRHRLGC